MPSHWKPSSPREKPLVCMIGAPWCEGQNLEGTDLAPTAMREAGLPEAVQRLGMEWLDAGDIDFAGHFKSLGISAAVKHLDSVVLYREWLSENSTDNFSTWQTKKRHASEVRTPSPNGAPLRQKLAHGSEAYPVDSAADAKGEVNVVNAEVMGAGLKLVHDAVVSACLKKAFVLTVGGDHSIAAATICAMTKTHPDLGVIWVDAHADANTPRTSPSGHYHGMPAAHCLGWFDQPGEAGEGLSASDLKGFEWFTSGCLPENKLAYIGLRDVDPEEGRMLRRSGVRVYTMRDVDKHGIARVCEMAIEALDPSHSCPIHLSLDIDGVDPHFAPGTGTCARGGLSYREVHYVCEEMSLTGRLVSMDLVEVNPTLDEAPSREAMHGDDPSIKTSSPTVRLGTEIVLSALGKQIC